MFQDKKRYMQDNSYHCDVTQAYPSQHFVCALSTYDEIRRKREGGLIASIIDRENNKKYLFVYWRNLAPKGNS